MALVIISGALANKPGNGGNAWSRLSWVHGFQKLGFEVHFLEQIAPETCVDTNGDPSSFQSSANLAYFKQTIADSGLENSCSLIYRDGRETYGLKLEQLTSLAARASLLFNISGHLELSALKEMPACKVYYDDDPGYTQFWHAANNSGARLEGHDFYFTLGENIGKPECTIPVNGVKWRPTRPPVFLEHWPVVSQPRPDRFTTIASWRGAYAPLNYNGITYGQKVHEFRKFIDLPRKSRHAFEIALQIDPADQKDLKALIATGWRITDPKAVAGSPHQFRSFVQGSAAEFSAAQGIYVVTNSGWFSDRSVRYLASGKPVLVQDTGFTRNYPVGRGLLAFRTLDEAVNGAENIVCSYEKHCQAARRIAEEYFDSRAVIRAILQEIGLPIP